MFSSANRDRKRVQKLRRKRKYSQAIQLQRHICGQDKTQKDEWALLAELAKESSKTELELAARVQLAKLTNADADQWLELAALAKEAGFNSDATDATFRAGDAAARAGKVHRAIDILDHVLVMSPGHRDAKRILKLMKRHAAANKPQEKTQRNWPPEETDEDTLPGPGDGALDGFDSRSTQPITTSAVKLSKLKQRDEQDEEADSGVDDDESTDSYVQAPQTWPSVLDADCLMFLGGIERVDESILGLAEEVKVKADGMLYEQGQPSHLLYCLDEGEVHAFRKRGEDQDFGVIEAGAYFGEVNTINNFPSTASVRASAPCTLRVITKESSQKAMRHGDAAAKRLLSFLRSCYLEVASNLSPLLAHCSSEELETLGDGPNWITFPPHSSLAREGTAGDLLTVIAGLATVTRDTKHLGYLTSGDLVGTLNPSPVTVRAQSMVSALKIPRAQLEDLSSAAQSKVEEHRSNCKRIISWMVHHKSEESG